MQARKEMLLFQKRKSVGLEYFAFGQRNCFDLVVLYLEHALDQMKIHVFVHVCLFEALTGDAGA